MSGLPHIDPNPNALLALTQAHAAFEKVGAEIQAAIDAANARITEQFNPVYYTAQSVLYEAMGKAAREGFTHRQMSDVMDCDGH